MSLSKMTVLDMAQNAQYIATGGIKDEFIVNGLEMDRWYLHNDIDLYIMMESSSFLWNLIMPTLMKEVVLC